MDSMVSGGCIISGSEVRRSILFSEVRARSFSKVANSVVLPDVEIGRHAQIQNAIIDRSVVIPEGMRIGMDTEEDLANGFRVTANGIVLVTRGMLGQADGSR